MYIAIQSTIAVVFTLYKIKLLLLILLEHFASHLARSDMYP